MLIIAKKMNDFSFGKLMEVYEESNLESARHLWPEESPARQLALAEADFYQYLREVFFRTVGAVYLIWEEKGHYVSALRLEPYQDGLLLEALETAPQQRKKGYASRLLQSALEYVGDQKVYSHVHKRNAASLRTHEKCGFRKVRDDAVYADGSVDSRSVTLYYKK